MTDFKNSVLLKVEFGREGFCRLFYTVPVHQSNRHIRVFAPPPVRPFEFGRSLDPQVGEGLHY